MKRTIERSLCAWILAGAGGSLALGMVACSDDDDHPLVPGGTGCLDCHTDEARLMATATPDDTPENEDSGEG